MKRHRRFGNGFATSNGQVIYYLAIAWNWLSETHGIAQPLADESRAAWAVRVLEAHYPDRHYDVVKRYAPEGVTVEQMEALEAALVDELTRLEIEQRYRVGEA
ncbi:hypothetical protein [Azotobacter chroococcum]|uniref:hypothetical protein n=1 Tax=Azotobacter chroococcum TaxID=353 RepID=UPI0010AEE81A|nr:hypothetical protein [Azotobacter chroococcum]TKD47325.1 hypothetical protein FCG41_00090 [Azotobacter chroococcum]